MDICLINRWEYRKIGDGCINVLGLLANEGVEVLVWHGYMVIVYISVYRDVIFYYILLAKEGGIIDL